MFFFLITSKFCRRSSGNYPERLQKKLIARFAERNDLYDRKWFHSFSPLIILYIFGWIPRNAATNDKYLEKYFFLISFSILKLIFLATEPSDNFLLSQWLLEWNKMNFQTAGRQMSRNFLREINFLFLVTVIARATSQVYLWLIKTHLRHH